MKRLDSMENKEEFQMEVTTNQPDESYKEDYIHLLTLAPCSS